MSLIHPGAGLGRSSEMCHLTSYHCCLSLGERKGVRQGAAGPCGVGPTGTGRGGPRLAPHGQPDMSPLGSMLAQMWAFLEFSVTLRPSTL